VCLIVDGVVIAGDVIGMDEDINMTPLVEEGEEEVVEVVLGIISGQRFK